MGNIHSTLYQYDRWAYITYVFCWKAMIMIMTMEVMMMTMRGTCRWMDRAHTWSPGVQPGRGNADAKVVNDDAKIIDVVLHQKRHHFRHDHVPKLPCFSMNSDKDLFDKIIKINVYPPVLSLTQRLPCKQLFEVRTNAVLLQWNYLLILIVIIL